MTYSTNNLNIDVYRITEKGKPCAYMFTSDSIMDVARRLRDEYGVETSIVKISYVLQGLQFSHRGFIFTKAGSPVPTYDPKKKPLKIARLDIDTKEVLEIYESVRQATRWVIEHGYTNNKSISGIVSNILKCCRGQKCKTVYKFVWRFVDADGKLVPLEDAPQVQFYSNSTPIQALDINTGEVVKTFDNKRKL